MILLRYLSREVFLTMFAVAGIVLVISVGWRFSGYLDKAAAGSLTQQVIFALMAWRLPGFLELIVPVSFFISIILVYGRLHAESEMIVMQSCGIGTWQLTGMTLVMALAVMVVTASLSLWLKPLGEQRVEALLRSQQQLTEFDTLIPGRFQTFGSGKRATYTEAIGKDGELEGVFIHEYQDADTGNEPRKAVTVIAETGNTRVEDNGQRFLVLKRGKRYLGSPGDGSYQVVTYEEYGQLIGSPEARTPRTRRAALPTAALMFADTPEANAEWHWRLSVVLLVPIIAMMAIPMSRVSPRQGRFTRLVPGMVLCFLYILLLSGASSALERGELPGSLGLWWVHGLFILITLGTWQLDRLANLLGRLSLLLRS